MKPKWRTEFDVALKNKDPALLTQGKQNFGIKEQSNVQQSLERSQHLFAYMLWKLGKLGYKLEPNELAIMHSVMPAYVIPLSANPATPTELRLRLLNDMLAGDSYYRRKAAENVYLPIKLIEELTFESSPYIRSAIAKNPSTPIRLLTALAQDADDDVRSAVARNHSASLKLLKLLAEDSCERVRLFIADNVSVPAQLLEKLSGDESCEVRKRVAANRSTPLGVLVSLAKDADIGIRENVAHNPASNLEVLAILESDEIEDINNAARIAIASNPLASSMLLNQLAKDKDEDIRCGVADNTSTSTKLLTLLSRDESDRVRSSVACNISTPETVLKVLAKDKNLSIHINVARNISTPTNLLKILAEDDAGRVQQGVAFNRTTPPYILKQLASVEDETVRHNVANHPMTPVETLIELADERRANNAVTRGAATYSGQIEELNLLSPSEIAALRLKLLDKLCYGTRPSYARVYGLMLIDCPIATLKKCSKSSLWLERCAVAQHANTPRSLVEKLHSDPHPVVAAAASWQLAQRNQFSGTKEGTTFLQKYFSTRELVDVYSSNWMKKSAARGGRFGKEVLSGFNTKFGIEYQGHLLLLAIDEYRDELKKDIKEIFPFLTGNSIGENGFPRIHDADFLFINLVTKQILAFGLGRKNRLFVSGYDFLNNYAKETLNFDDELNIIGSESPPPFIKRFLALDHARVVPFLINALEKAGDGWEDFNGGEFEDLLKKGADKDGVFRDSCGEEYSRDEVTENVSLHHVAGKKIEDGEAPFRELFKDCDLLSWELASE